MTSNRSKGVRGADVLDTASPEGEYDGYQTMQPSHGRTCGPTRRSTKGQWTAEEDALLCRAVQRFKGKNWKKIAECFKERTDVQCLHRWQKVLNPELVKGPWSKEEDDIIVEMVNKYGAKKWSTIAQALPGRIGKQCRERWHNHLNPSINKNAWTQEEELTLIRAHQLYGNKWAELTKFLPGRTDNSIKNHWNSSVKKKLDSYLASGLLAQFRAMPNMVNSDLCNSSSSKMQQSSRDNSSIQDGTETEDVSECSQSSTAAGCSQSDYNRPSAAPLHTQEEFKRSEVENREKGQSPSSSSCSRQYYTSLDEVACVIPEDPRGTINFVNPCENNLSHEAGSSGDDGHSLFGSHELLNSSALDLVRETSGLTDTAGHCRVGWDETKESRSPPLQKSLNFSSSTSVKNSTMQPHEADDCGVTTAEEGVNVCFRLENMTQCTDFNMHTRTDLLICRSESHNCENIGAIPSNSSYQQNSCNVLGASGQTLYGDPPVLHPNDDKLIFSGGYVQARDVCNVTQHSELNLHSCDGFAYPCDSTIPLCDSNIGEVCVPVEPNCSNANIVENFGAVSLESEGNICSIEENTPVKTHQQEDSEALFYEPPRFPSLELPFFSCDLINSGGDLQQAYSPLGIRQLMMSSGNCSTPFNLWDSPSRDDSPDFFLKNAARSFLCTPSILKKRQRELMSPIQEQKSDKKVEREFPYMSAIFDQSGTSTASMSSIFSPKFQLNKNSEASSHDKENHHHGGITLPDVKVSQDAAYNVDVGKIKLEFTDADSSAKVDGPSAAIEVQHSSGILIEQDMNAPHFFSPDRDVYMNQNILNSASKTPRDLNLKEMTTLNRVGPGCSESSLWTLHISPTNNENKHTENIDVQSFSLYGDTPLMKRSIESPSAWKSPWFANTFLPGPRIDTDITIEDIGYLMSPGDVSYDALTLMRQMGEQSAPALAEARQVLASENSELSWKEQYSEHINNPYSDTDLPVHKPPHSNALNERRVLDFSGCETPARGPESQKSPGVSFPSPSSYLMKGCR
ncbi:hypothetical protein ACHQM5_002182 [Ranunculus cassubicifolius]